MSHDAAAHADHQPHINSFAIFMALCVCTVASMALDFIPMNRAVVAVLALAIAVMKAQFVMRYFMHLKFEGRWKYVFLLPTTILACGLPLALAPDIALHYYTPVKTTVAAEVEYQAAHGGGHHQSADEGDPHGAVDSAAHAGGESGEE